MSSGYLLIGLRNVTIQLGKSRRSREYSIPVLTSGHCLQLTTQGIAQCHFQHRQTDIKSLCQLQITAIMQNGTIFVAWIKIEISLHALTGENFLKKIFATFHILCTFVVQSRAFLSQLSVTGDESGFFYALLQSNEKDFIFSNLPSFFTAKSLRPHAYSANIRTFAPYRQL